MDYRIFINDAKFVAEEDTIDKVIEALKEAGWTLNESTGSYEEPVEETDFWNHEATDTQLILNGFVGLSKNNGETLVKFAKEAWTKVNKTKIPKDFRPYIDISWMVIEDVTSIRYDVTFQKSSREEEQAQEFSAEKYHISGINMHKGICHTYQKCYHVPYFKDDI